MAFTAEVFSCPRLRGPRRSARVRRRYILPARRGSRLRPPIAARAACSNRGPRHGSCSARGFAALSRFRPRERRRCPRKRDQNIAGNCFRIVPEVARIADVDGIALPALDRVGHGLTAERHGDCVLKIADHQPIVGQGIAVGHYVEGERFGFRVFRISENDPSW